MVEILGFHFCLFSLQNEYGSVVFVRFTDFPDPIIPIIDLAPEIRYNRENAFRARVHSDKELS